MNTLTLPEVRPARADDDDLDHYYCCDPDRARCGADVSDAEEFYGDEVTEDLCVVCLDLFRADVPCGQPLCRVREWLRGDRRRPW